MFVLIMVKNKNIIAKSLKIGALTVAIFAVAHCVFAIGTGYFTIGEDKNTKSSSSFSNIKSNVSFSLKDSYGISSKEAFTRNHKKVINSNVPASGSLVSYQKGNVVYVLPYKAQKGLKMPGFISAAPSQKAPLNR